MPALWKLSRIEQVHTGAMNARQLLPGTRLTACARLVGATMTAVRLLAISLVVLFLATCGIIGFFVLSFAYFNYQGSGMDWIYPTSGLMILMWLGSVVMAVASRVEIAVERKRRSSVLS